MKITATIIAYNEEKDIAGCITSARQVCDEVIVIVDTKTTDATARVAKAAGARIFHQEYLGDGPQKAWAVPRAQHDWILSMDADERLDQDMVAFIQSLDLNDHSIDAYSFRRKNYVGNHWIKAAGFYPDQLTRLYHRQRAGYSEKKYHAAVEAKTTVKSSTHILHRTYDSYADWLRKVDSHSTLDAWALFQKGKKASRTAPVLHAITSFLRKFILKGGFLQGGDGFTVMLTSVLRTYFKYLKLNEMYESSGMSIEPAAAEFQKQKKKNIREKKKDAVSAAGGPVRNTGSSRAKTSAKIK